MWSGIAMLRLGVMLLITLTQKCASTRYIHFLGMVVKAIVG